MKNGESIHDAFARPNREWVCGGREGSPCGAGPDTAGRCRADRDCRPVQEDGRWHCMRPPSAGGPCSQGPMPDGSCSQPVETCLPARTRRAVKRRAVRWTLVAAIGILAVLLGGRWGDPVPSPGPLSSAHASIENCAACHPGSTSGAVSWVTAAIGRKSPAEHNAACTACHGAGPGGGSPHTVPAETLAPLTAKAERSRKGGGGLAFPAPDFRQEPVACATCHREHRGRDQDLGSMADERCQTCHVLRFDGSGGAHPGFTDYPSSRPPLILFSHVTHYRKHIPEKFRGAVTLRCDNCHLPEADGGRMMIMAFAEVCDACHGPEVMGEDFEASDKGIPFLSIPALDLVTLRNAGVAIEGWPDDAKGGLTPFMTALLSQSSDGREVLDRVAKLDLGALADASEDDIAAVGNLVEAIESLILDLRDEGPEAVDIRLKLGRIRKGNPPRAGALASGLTAETMAAFILASLPHLADDLRSVEGGRGTAWKPSGGWFVENHTLYFRPTGHYDTISRNWLEYLARFGKKKNPAGLTEAISLFRSKETPGKCTKCHDIGQFEPSPAFRGWTTRAAGAFGPRFTTFSHKPHHSAVPLPPEGKENCTACHVLAEGDGSAEGQEMSPDFASIPMERCVACHDGAKVADRCTLCHAYHVYPFTGSGAQRR